MPWHKVQDHSECSSGKPWAVVKDSDGSVAGCHATEADADKQLAALYANEPKAAGDVNVTDVIEQQAEDEVEALGGKPNPGTKKDKRLKSNKTEGDADTFDDREDGDCPPGHKMGDDGECVPMSEMETLASKSAEAMKAAPAGTWEGVLVVEGVKTGDGRKFAVNSITWAEPPLPLRWKKEDAHGGQNDVTVSVGRIDSVWRDGPRVMARGVFDLGSEDGAEAHRRMEAGFLKGVSIDADDITDADVELIWPEEPKSVAADGEDPDMADIIGMMFMSPEETIFHAGRIRAATLVDIPAFVEAYIKLADAAGEPPLVASAEAAQLGAVGSHSTETSDGTWDAGANEKRLPTPMSAATAKKAYAWVSSSSDEVTKSDCKFIHHEVNADGAVGPANLTACSAAIGVLHGGRGGTNIPEADRRGVYNHVAAHLRAAGHEPEPFIDDVEALVAHAVGERWAPPVAWFDDPKLGQLVPIVVTDEGRVYGHVAQWGECHIGYVDTCVMTPREDSFPYFLTGELTADSGDVVPVGQITVDTGHAPLTVRPAVAAEHYEHTGAVVADVTLGNDRHGIWCAGAIRPDADAMRVHKLRASGQVSPDWRRIGGELRMVALLTVNASGYQVPKMKARVASGEVQSLVAAGMVNVGPRETEEQLNRRALRYLRDQLVARVHPNGEVDS